MADLRGCLVIGWRSSRTWRINVTAAAGYPVMEIADAEPVRFPDFNALTLDYPQLQAVIREHRYAAWRTALSAVIGIYLITDTRDGRHYVGKADGAEPILQRWAAYATDGHGGNVEAAQPHPDHLPTLGAAGLRSVDTDSRDRGSRALLQARPRLTATRPEPQLSFGATCAPISSVGSNMTTAQRRGITRQGRRIDLTDGGR